MAIGIHVANVAFLAINTSTNQPVKSGNSTISSALTTEHRHVVLPDSSNPNTDGYPTVAEYLVLEAAQDYIANHISQNLIVTYNVGDANAAT